MTTLFSACNSLFCGYNIFWVVDELDHVLKYIAVYIGSEKGNMATP